MTPTFDTFQFPTSHDAGSAMSSGTRRFQLSWDRFKVINTWGCGIVSLRIVVELLGRHPDFHVPWAERLETESADLMGHSSPSPEIGIETN